MAPFSKDRFTFFTQQRSLSLHARRNPIDVWNVLAAQPHRVVIAKSLLPSADKYKPRAGPCRGLPKELYSMQSDAEIGDHL
jgi:hypothetical protein